MESAKHQLGGLIAPSNHDIALDHPAHLQADNPAVPRLHHQSFSLTFLFRILSSHSSLTVSIVCRMPCNPRVETSISAMIAQRLGTVRRAHRMNFVISSSSMIQILYTRGIARSSEIRGPESLGRYRTNPARSRTSELAATPTVVLPLFHHSATQ